MDSQGIPAKVQDLGDIELAMLLSLVAKQHCLIHTEPEAVDSLEEEVARVASSTFGLSAQAVQCTSSTTLEEFSNAILLSSNQSPILGSSQHQLLEESGIAHIVIAKNLNLASDHIQMQALELLRTNRIFTHTAIYTAPKPFLLVVLSASMSVPLSRHLSDFLFLSHYHDPEDGFPALEEASEWVEDDSASQSSVVRRVVAKVPSVEPIFNIKDLESLSSACHVVTISTEILGYMYNILTFLRMHRAISGGVTPRATKHFQLLVKCLAVLHGLKYATPSLVALATPKIYRHRLVLVKQEDERSMQYGSDSGAIEVLLGSFAPASVIENVLTAVEAPL